MQIFEQLAESPQISSWIKSYFHKLIMQVHEANRLDDKLASSGKSTTCIMSVTFLAMCVKRNC